MATTYIYSLIDPRDGSCRYIGKTDHPEKRARQHVNAALRAKGSARKTRWLRELHDEGLEPELLVLQEIRQDEWRQTEKEAIEDFDGDLLNVAPGGGGPPDWNKLIEEAWNNPERRKLVGELSKARWADPEYREKIRTGMDAFWSKPENRKRASEIQRRAWADNEEAKSKISKNQQKNWANPDYRQRVTESNIQAWSEPERLAEHSERIASLWQDDEYREKTIAAINDPEMQARRRESMATTWSDPEKREKQAEIARELWQDPEYRARQEDSIGETAPKISESLKEFFTEHPEAKRNLSEKAIERMADPERREHLSDVAKGQWTDPEFRGKQMRARNAGKLRSDVDKAAERLGVKKVTIYKYLYQGKFGHKEGANWIITDEEIEALMRENLT